MRTTMPLMRLFFFLLMLVVWSGTVFAVEKTTRYSNDQFGFSFQYPASWVFVHSQARDIRVKIVAPEGSPAAECAVVVKEYPNAAKAKQGDIDQVFLDPPTVQELEEMLGQESGQVTVTKAMAGKLDKRPAHVARYRMHLSFNEYLSGQVAMTATPGLTWSVACSGRGEDSQESEKNYQFWQQSIQALMASFRFK